MKNPADNVMRDEAATRCSGCGAYNYADDKFCACCGDPVRTLCGACGAVVWQPVAIFCTQCGARLGADRSRART